MAVRRFGPFESAMEKAWNSFCAETGCKLSVEMVPMDLHPLYEALLGSGGLIKGEWDLAHINTDWLFGAQADGALEDLAPYIAANPPAGFPGGWSGSLLGMQQFGQHVAGLPFHDGPECLVYRKDLFEDEGEKKAYADLHGEELVPPRTWEHFHRIARFFHRPGENLYGTVFAGFPDGHNTVFDFALQVWTRNGELADAGNRVNIDTAAALEGLRFYRAVFHDREALHPRSAELDSVQAGMAFARGEVAMMVNWFGFASMCEVIDESVVKGKVDIANIPHGDGGESASLNVYWVYAVGSGSAHKQAAYDFICHAVNEQNDKLLTLEGGIGCRLSTWHDPAVNSTVPYYHKLEALHRHARSLPQKQDWAQIAAVIDEVVLAATQTDNPLEELLREGQQKIDSLEQLAQYGDTI